MHGNLFLCLQIFRFSDYLPFFYSFVSLVYLVPLDLVMASVAALIATVTVLSILVITNLIGNSLVCVIIMKNQDMRCI